MSSALEGKHFVGYGGLNELLLLSLLADNCDRHSILSYSNLLCVLDESSKGATRRGKETLREWREEKQNQKGRAFEGTRNIGTEGMGKRSVGQDG